MAADAFRQQGARAAVRVGRFSLSRQWIRHQLEDAHWDVPQWRAVTATRLSGAAFDSRPGIATVVVLWQKPEGIATDAEAGRDSRHKAIAPAIRMGRSWPREVPADHVPFPRSAIETSVVARFEAQAGIHADREAWCTPSERLSYGELNARANRAARTILARQPSGTGPVALLMSQEEPSIPAILAILKTGRPYVALDPEDAPERWAGILRIAGAETVITTAERARLIERLPDAPVRRMVWEEMNAGSDQDPGRKVTAGDLAALFFTSGSTGSPRAVARDHRQFLHSCWLNTSTYFVSPSDRQSLLYFPGFTASVPNIYDTLLNGAALCALNPRMRSAASLLDWVRSERITHFNPPIGLWRELVQSVPVVSRWPHLRLVTLAGQPLYGKDLRNFQAAFGSSTVLLYVLAMTEAGAVTQAWFDGTSEAPDGAVPAGYPLPDKAVTILDDSGAPAPPGEIGRIAITSRYLSLGYWNDEAGSQSAFVPAEDGAGGVTFRTSDRGRLRPDGCLEFFGREDSIVKVRGYRVDTAAIESVLNSHPRIGQAAVVAADRSDGEPGVLAFLCGSAQTRPSSGELRDFLARSLPHYMSPERFLWLDALPLTASGKVDRRGLSAMAPASAEDLPRAVAGEGGTTESVITECWKHLLKVEQVGADDNFFDLGGDSLLAMQMIRRVEQRLGITMHTDSLEVSTVKRLVQAVDAARSPGGKAAVLRSGGSGITPVTQRRKLTPRRILKRVMENGPMFGGRMAPYPVGARLCRALSRCQWLFRPMYRAEFAALRAWQEELGVVDDGRAFSISLQANLWMRWRQEALLQPGVADDWVVVVGDLDALLDPALYPHGVVLCVPHAGRIMPLLQRYAEARGREAIQVIHDVALNVIADRNERLARQRQSLTGRMAAAVEILERNGVALVAGDGLKSSSQAVDVAFHNRARTFGVGAAWLALHTGASFVPVFVQFEDSGRIRVIVEAALVSAASDPDERVRDITRQYGALYARYWPTIYTSMAWGHMRRNLALPRSRPLAEDGGGSARHRQTA